MLNKWHRGFDGSKVLCLEETFFFFPPELDDNLKTPTQVGACCLAFRPRGVKETNNRAARSGGRESRSCNESKTNSC